MLEKSFEMTLVICKVQIKLRWTKHSVLALDGAENVGAEISNIICTTKDTKAYVFYVLFVTLSSKDNQKYQNFLSESLKYQYIGANIKRKVKIKIQQLNVDFFSNHVL